MTIPREKHPLITTQALGAFTVAGLFWAGLTMLDAHPGVGAALCLIGIGCTVSVYFKPIKQMPKTLPRRWPWVGLALLLIELLLPGYLLSTRENNVARAETNIQPQVGQVAGTINNNGSVFNAPISTPLPEPQVQGEAVVTNAPNSKIGRLEMNGLKSSGYKAVVRNEGAIGEAQLNNATVDAAPSGGKRPRVDIDHVRIEPSDGYQRINESITITKQIRPVQRNDGMFSQAIVFEIAPVRTVEWLTLSILDKGLVSAKLYQYGRSIAPRARSLKSGYGQLVLEKPSGTYELELVRKSLGSIPDIGFDSQRSVNIVNSKSYLDL